MFFYANESCEKVWPQLLPVIAAWKVIYYCVMRVQQTSVSRVAAKVAVGYFENTVAGQITEPYVVVFGQLLMYRGRPKCI